MIALNARSDKTKPSKMMSIDPIGKQKYFEGVGFDRNICTHFFFTKLEVLFCTVCLVFYGATQFSKQYILWMLSLPNLHFANALSTMLWKSMQINVKIFCAGTFSTSQNKF